MSVISARPRYQRRAVPSKYDPAWIAAEFSGVERAIPAASIRTARASETITANDQTVLYDATSAAITATLPPAAQAQGLLVTLKKIDASANVVTIQGTVDATVNPTLSARWSSLTVQSDGSAWYKLAAV